MEKRIVVQAPGMSRAILADLLGGISYTDDRFRVVEGNAEAKLNADPATVALVTTLVSVATTEMVKAVIGAFVDWLKNSRKPSKAVNVHVTVAMTMGGKKSIIISDPAQLDNAFPDFPSEATEIRYVSLRAEP